MRFARLLIPAGLLWLTQAWGLEPFVYEYADEPRTPVQRRLDTLVPKRDAASGRQLGLPLLVLFSASWCSYCERLKDTVLLPMVNGGHYDDQVLIRELAIDGQRQFDDFAGIASSEARLSEHYHIGMVPTLLFLGPDGRELVPRMVGLTTEEYFGGYLDDNIETAYRRLQAGMPGPAAP